MACDAEDCAFQMQNDDEIVTSVQEESDPVNDETKDNEDISNESSKGPSIADAFSVLRDSYGVVRTIIIVLLYSTIAAQENQAAKKRRYTMCRFHILRGSHSNFGYPNSVRSQLIRINDVLLYNVYQNRPQSLDELHQAISAEISDITLPIIRSVFDNFDFMLCLIVPSNG
ncbi:hypothetical protein TNCV_1219361 [Trichonephila clavipes]|nr:hypothetical protein TNCV_1219361 [Trichonephila clavipes]